MRILISLLLFGSCAVSCCAQEEALYPQRIISLGPAITEQVYLLGAEDRLVGVTSYCRQRPEAAPKEIIGTVQEINLEKIVSLEPDLVLATPLTNPRALAKLKKLNIKTLHFSQANNFQQICAQFLHLGKIMGKEKQAKAIVQEAQQKAALVAEKARTRPRQKVLLQLGANPLVVAGNDSFLDDCIQLAGGINAVGGKTSLYSREKALQDDPDVIIIISMGLAGREEKQNWQRYPNLKAVKFERIYIVEDYKFCSPTPLSFVQALDEMSAILAGEQ